MVFNMMEKTQAVPEKPLHDLLSHDMVDIYVGSENTHWILHEKLLCAKSTFFRKIFYNDNNRASSTKSFGLPEDEDEPFRTFVGWLYSGFVLPPREESDLAVLFDLYLMGEKWNIPALRADTIGAVRTYYADRDTYPGLRRVQYVYANTEDGSEMRAMLVQSIARMLALAKNIPAHWDKALRKNGQLAVDIIKAVQEWHLEGKGVPDARALPVDVSGLDLKSPGLDSISGKTEVEDLGGAVRPFTNKIDDSPKGLFEELPNGLNNAQPNGSVAVDGY